MTSVSSGSCLQFQAPPILVTGAAGFIGFHLTAALLKAGHSVIGVDNLNPYYDVQLKRDRLAQLTLLARTLESDSSGEGFFFHEGDIEDRVAMEAMWTSLPDVKHVIHLAAQAGVRYSLKNPFSYTRSNIEGTLVMMELCRHRAGFEHFIFASSSSVYGLSSDIPFSLKDRCDHPISLYAVTKRSNELMAHSYAHLFGIPMTGLRFFTVYGPWGRPDMSAFLFTKAILEETPIPVFNDGHMKRDFTYVDDIVAGIRAVLQKPPEKGPSKGGLAPYQIYNLGNHRAEPLLRYISVLERAIGKKARLMYMPMQPGDVPETYADISESRTDFGFSPQIPIDEGIPRFVHWYRSYFSV